MADIFEGKRTSEENQCCKSKAFKKNQKKKQVEYIAEWEREKKTTTTKLSFSIVRAK